MNFSEMERDVSSVVERVLSKDRRAQFRGTAKVRFNSLNFEKLCPREYDARVVARLVDKFKVQGVLRIEPKNRIPGLISAEVLRQAIDGSPKVSMQTLLNNPQGVPLELHLPANSMIECLQGLHRVQAGMSVLARKDWWWTIDLYLYDASQDLQTALSQDYSESVNFTDGEIFQAIREYYYDDDKQLGTIFAEKCMWARLSINKRKDLRQILKHKAFARAFDALRILPGLWVGFRIEHKFLSMKCDEEILHYLEHILAFWMGILDGRKELTRYVDRNTVEQLQLRAPGCSHKDLSMVETAFKNKTIFPGIENDEDRLAIWERLRGVSFLIPSMYTFFEDIKYLKAPAKVMRKLFSKTPDTVYAAMSQSVFSGCNQKHDKFLIQTSERSFREEKGGLADQIEFGYRNVWLYAWRNWSELGPDCPRKEDDQPTPVPQEPSITKWYELANLAKKMGFESNEISHLLSSDPDRRLATEVLHKARDPAHYTYDVSAFQLYLDQIVALFKLAVPKQQDHDNPSLDQDDEGLERRCGRAYERAHAHSSNYLYLDDLLRQQKGERKAICPSFVRASVFYAFFGTNSQVLSQRTEPAPTANSEATMNALEQGNTTAMEMTDGEAAEAEDPSESHTTTVHSPVRQVRQDIAGHAIANPGNEVDVNNTVAQTRQEVSGHAAADPQGSEAAETTAMTVYSPVLAQARQNPTPMAQHANTLQGNPPARIFTKIWENNQLKEQDRPLMMDRDEVIRTMGKMERKGFRLFGTDSKALNSGNCFDIVTANGTNTIVLIRGSGIDIDRRLLHATASALQSRSSEALETRSDEGGPKRLRQG